MCILFLYVNPKPLPGQFRLILAANRDEAYRRPSRSAHYWDEDKTVIGGRDLETGKEGGSWLAVSTRGRIAALLNIMSLNGHSPDLLGRGSLTADFVKGRFTGMEYLRNISVNSKIYRPFNFLTIEISPTDINVCEYSNVGDTPQPVAVPCEYLGIGNSVLDKPFVKVTAGLKTFQDVIKTYGLTSDRKTLSNKLLEFLKSREIHFPDAEMIRYAEGIPGINLEPFSSVFVQHLQKGYGTRAHSIITVDTAGQMDFSEWAMEQPINPEAQHWESNHFSCNLNYESQ